MAILVTMHREPSWGQRKDNKPYVVYYVSRTMNETQVTYSNTKKELLVIVFALEKFHLYLINSMVIIFIDLVALKHLLKKSDSKPYIIRWVLLLQEFDSEIHDNNALKNLVVVSFILLIPGGQSN